MEHLLLSRIKSLVQGALIMIELNLFLYKSVQDCGRLWSPWAMFSCVKESLHLKTIMHFYQVKVSLAPGSVAILQLLKINNSGVKEALR